MKTAITILVLSLMTSLNAQEPLKIAVIGLSHGHVNWVFNDLERGDVEVIGIVEPVGEVVDRYVERYDIDRSLVYPDIEALLAEQQPEAVTAFGNTYDHLDIVRACAPKGIHVMVEKPLAVSVEHAHEMRALAERHGIHLLTNYETTWYPTNHKAYELVRAGEIGDLRKIVVRDGHRGPKKIGVESEFLDWLTDPKLNGGGALPDFGCYGANLMTWLHNGQRPISVMAITQQLQPENNPAVEDEAVILLKYPNSNGIIEASWNWPIGRKDMEVYGETGAIIADNRRQLRVRKPIGYDDFSERPYVFDERTAPFDNPFAYLAGVVRGEIIVEEIRPFLVG